MKKEVELLTIVILSFILFITFVSAEISFNEQPEETYNLGDDLYFSFLIAGKGVMDIDLICGENTEKIYLNYVDSEYGKDVPIMWPLDAPDLMGTCKVSALFNEQVVESSEFFISNQSFIELSLKDMNFDPGKLIEFEGTAVKENEKPLEGFAEIYIEEPKISVIQEVANGSFSGTLKLPDNIASGMNKLNVRAYEKNSQDQIINKGFYEVFININQIPNFIEIRTNDLNLKPGENLLFTPIVYDQGGQEVYNQTLNIIIRDSQGARIKEFISDTGQENIFPLTTRAISGYWQIEVSLNKLSEKKEFYVKLNQQAKFEMMNNTLIVTNIGNIPYTKTIEVGIGDETRLEKLDLELNETIKFKLSAPKGNYDIKVNDGSDDEFSNKGVALTGRTIGVSKITGMAISKTSVKSIIWVFIIVVLGFFILILFKKKKKGKFTLSLGKIKEKLKNKKLRKSKLKSDKKIEGKETDAEENATAPKIISKGANAIHSLVLKGHKQNSAVVVLKLKNREELLKSKSNAWQTIKKAIDEIKDNKGKIYFTEGYIIGIFSPIITRTFKNDKIAVDVASEIGKNLTQHNKKFVQKINFGLSVNTGELIVQKKDDNLLFTPIGNTITLGKKIAKIANKELFLSKPTHQKLLSDVKTTKLTKQGTEVYSINRMTDRTKQAKFIQEFMKRQEAEKKRKKK